MNQGQLNRVLLLVTLVLVLGLAGSLYMYNSTRADLKDTLLVSEQTSAELLRARGDRLGDWVKDQ